MYSFPILDGLIDKRIKKYLVPQSEEMKDELNENLELTTEDICNEHRFERMCTREDLLRRSLTHSIVDNIINRDKWSQEDQF